MYPLLNKLTNIAKIYYIKTLLITTHENIIYNFKKL